MVLATNWLLLLVGWHQWGFVCGKKAWRLACSFCGRRRVCVCRQQATQASVALESLPGDQRRAVRLHGLPTQLSQMKADFFKRPVILQLRQKEHCFSMPSHPTPPHHPLLGMTQENPIYLEMHNFVPCIDSCAVLISYSRIWGSHKQRTCFSHRQSFVDVI